MSLTEFAQNIVPELREAISDPAHTLTAAERFTLWEMLAQVKVSVVEGSPSILPRAQASGASSPYTPPFWAHVAAELGSMRAQLGVVGPPPETSDFWHQAMWRLRQQIGALLCQIDVPSEFVDAETRLQDALDYLVWVGNYIDRWRDALHHLEAYDTKLLYGLVSDMGYQVLLIRERAKNYGYRELGGESRPSPVVLSPTPSDREDMLLRRLHEHMEIMRDWARYLRSAPDLMEARRLADRIDDHAEADHRWMAEHGHEASS